MLSYMVKSELGLKPTDTITVGDIKGFSGSTFNLISSFYISGMPSNVTSTYVENFDGMQYLKLLPSTTGVALAVNVASDPSSNPDLTPLDGVNLNSLQLTGNFSDAAYKEIDASQVPKLTYSNDTYEIGLEGDGQEAVNDGINEAELKELAPFLVQYANASHPGNSIYLTNSSITDFSPLNGINQTSSAYINVINNTYDPDVIYGVDGQPVSFTAEPIMGLYGNSLSNNYHYSTTVPAANVADDDLINSGNGEYVLKNGDDTQNLLVYGDANDYSQADSYVNATYGNVTFIYAGTTAQPIIWQAHPNVTIAYEDQGGQPILVNGKPLTKTINGVNIGDTFDLTQDASLAGYTYAGTLDQLKGSYTQNPQIIDLEYKANPATAPTQPVTPPTVVNPTIITTPITVAAPSATPVQVYGPDGDPIVGKQVVLTDTTITTSAYINGQLCYEIAPNEWVPASAYNAYVAKTGVVRTFGADTTLVDSEGNAVSSKLSPNTAWKYDKVISIKGKTYYEVATNEYLAADSGVQFTPVTTKTGVTVRDAAVVYNSQGQRSGSILRGNSSWATDGCAMIGGVKMYRIATDEWISDQDVNQYQPAPMTYYAQYRTDVYDGNGTQLPVSAALKAGTSWKIDRVVTINGQKYCRIATNEYIQDLAANLGSNEGVVVPAQAGTSIQLTDNAVVYNEKGEPQTKTLPSGSTLTPDASETIGGVLMYRIAPDEFVSSSDIQPYSVANNTVKVVVNTNLYNSKGEVLTNILLAGTSWRCDKIVTINGQKYIRVASDEFVKDVIGL